LSDCEPQDSQQATGLFFTSMPASGPGQSHPATSPKSGESQKSPPLAGLKDLPALYRCGCSSWFLPAIGTAT
jgi:hypothetical protein